MRCHVLVLMPEHQDQTPDHKPPEAAAVSLAGALRVRQQHGLGEKHIQVVTPQVGAKVGVEYVASGGYAYVADQQQQQRQRQRQQQQRWGDEIMFMHEIVQPRQVT